MAIELGWKPLLALNPTVAARDLPPGQGTWRPPSGPPVKLSNCLLFGPVQTTYVPKGTWVYDLPKLLGLPEARVREQISDNNPLSVVLRITATRFKD